MFYTATEILKSQGKFEMLSKYQTPSQREKESEIEKEIAEIEKEKENEQNYKELLINYFERYINTKGFDYSKIALHLKEERDNAKNEIAKNSQTRTLIDENYEKILNKVLKVYENDQKARFEIEQQKLIKAEQDRIALEQAQTEEQNKKIINSKEFQKEYKSLLKEARLEAFFDALGQWLIALSGLVLGLLFPLMIMFLIGLYAKSIMRAFYAISIILGIIVIISLIVKIFQNMHGINKESLKFQAIEIVKNKEKLVL